MREGVNEVLFIRPTFILRFCRNSVDHNTVVVNTNDFRENRYRSFPYGPKSVVFNFFAMKAIFSLSVGCLAAALFQHRRTVI